MIRFLEARFAGHRTDLVEADITPWRRAVVGDLTTAFDFKTPNRSRPVTLPGTDDFKPTVLVRHPDQVPAPPANQRLPGQERGVRPARPIPYTLHTDGRASEEMFSIDFGNSGGAAAVFQVRSAGSAQPPRTYTVEPGKHLADTWESVSGYDLYVHGPNGYFRGFKGGNPGRQHARLDVTASYDERDRTIVLEIRNRSSARTEPSRATRVSSTAMPAISRTVRTASAIPRWADCSSKPPAARLPEPGFWRASPACGP